MQVMVCSKSHHLACLCASAWANIGQVCCWVPALQWHEIIQQSYTRVVS